MVWSVGQERVDWYEFGALRFLPMELARNRFSDPLRRDRLMTTPLSPLEPITVASMNETIAVKRRRR
jgi:hypothetical protein